MPEREATKKTKNAPFTEGRFFFVVRKEMLYFANMKKFTSIMILTVGLLFASCASAGEGAAKIKVKPDVTECSYNVAAMEASNVYEVNTVSAESFAYVREAECAMVIYPVAVTVAFAKDERLCRCEKPFINRLLWPDKLLS